MAEYPPIVFIARYGWVILFPPHLSLWLTFLDMALALMRPTRTGIYPLRPPTILLFPTVAGFSLARSVHASQVCYRRPNLSEGMLKMNGANLQPQMTLRLCNRPSPRTTCTTGTTLSSTPLRTYDVSKRLLRSARVSTSIGRGSKHRTRLDPSTSPLSIPMPWV